MLGASKTKRGRRTVALSQALTAQLREHIAGRAPDDLVFTCNGRAIRNDVFQHRVWAPALDTIPADLPRRPRIHDLRHSHASHLIAAGVALPVIQRRLGHESIKVTVDAYGHLADDADRLAVAALDR